MCLARVLNKMSYYPSTRMKYFEELDKFLKQSKTGNLKTSHFRRSYEDLKVKVSFGQGGRSRVPWISFLADGQTTSDGIYPVYLYYKDQNILILAYGLSETNLPKISWEVTSAQNISSYFKEIGFGKPPRYGDSMIYKLYPLDKNLNPEEIDEDLLTLIHIYKAKISSVIGSVDELKLSLSNKGKLQTQFDHRLFQKELIRSNLNLEPHFSLRFIASLLTKPFVILTGLSGSGKTKLAQAFSKWICESENQVCIVPVGADWTNRDPLLGYPNALESGKYVKPDNGVLDLIINALHNPKLPYFLILDEMNLSHVERYFADFLSVMESDESILLHPDYLDKVIDVPSKVKLPKNLFIVGTVNIDETTYMFSPKVLDRANVIEFRVSVEQMESFLNLGQTLNLESLSTLGSNMAESFLNLAKDKSLKFTDKVVINEVLLKFFKELRIIGAEFGYRSASEILRFAAVVNKIEPEWSINQIIDAAVMQKILPKIHGSRRKLEPVIKLLGSLCLMNPADIEGYLNKTDTVYQKVAHYPISFEKITRMYKNLVENGFTSYAEA